MKLHLLVFLSRLYGLFLECLRFVRKVFNLPLGKIIYQPPQDARASRVAKMSFAISRFTSGKIRAEARNDKSFAAFETNLESEQKGVFCGSC